MIGFVGSLGVGKGLFVGRRNVEGCRVVRREGRAVFSRRVRMCEGGSDGSASKTVEKVGGRGTLQILQDPSGDTFYLKDEKTKEKRELTLREKESLFLDALYSYGSNEDLVLTDDQFDLLKEDLTWEGSHVMLLNDQEKKFLEAARAYHKGKPLMSDEEFDSMRDILRLAGSPVAVSKGPKCSLETMVCATDCTPDNGRMFITQLPAAGIGALIWAAITYEVTPLRNIPHIYTLIGGIPLIALIGKILTGLVLGKPGIILVGDCPNCGEPIRTYFGNIVTVEGPTERADRKCPSCKMQVTVIANEKRIEQRMDQKMA